jgi:hypothetical protein
MPQRAELTKKRPARVRSSLHLAGTPFRVSNGQWSNFRKGARIALRRDLYAVREASTLNRLSQNSIAVPSSLLRPRSRLYSRTTG